MKSQQTNSYTFSFASDIDTEISYLFSCGVKIPYQQLLVFICFMNTFFESN